MSSTRTKNKDEKTGAGGGGAAACVEGGPRNLGELSRVLGLLDPLRDAISETMGGEEPPIIIVLGTQSSGKSTILERMIMLPIFPRDAGLCTRVAIKVHLRRDIVSPPSAKIEVCQYVGDSGSAAQSVPGTQSDIAWEDLCGNAVRDAMEELVRSENDMALEDNVNGVAVKSFIRLQITSPDVPNLDFCDLPGT